MPIGSIAIDRFRITALAPADHTAPDRLRGKLDALNEGALGAALARRLALPFSVFDDDRVILLRRVDLDLTESAAADAARLADRLACLLALVLARLGEAPGENVVLFASRPAFVAAFLRSALRGEAWEKWWFGRFAGLKPLTLSSCLRTAMTADLDVGVRALTMLTATERAQVVDALGAADVRQILADLAGLDDDGVGGEGGVLTSALAAIGGAPAAAAPPSPEHAILHFYLAGFAAAPALPRGVLLRAAEMLSVLQPLPPEQREAVARQLRGGGIGRLPRTIAPARLAALAPLFAAAAAVRRVLADQLAARAAEPASQAPRFTPFGGLLVLAPHLPARCDPAVALAALAACAGPDAAAQALADPVLQQVLGVASRDTMSEVKACLDRLDAAAADALAALGNRPAGRDRKWLVLPRALRRNPAGYRAVQALGHAALRDLARRLPGFAEASAAFLWRNLLAVGAHIAAEGDGFHVIIDRPPLDVLLSMTGLADRVAVLPDGRPLRLERAR